jgi:UDP-glucose 4-epimerase
VYGDPATIPISEDAPARPRSPYATSKRAAEEYLVGFKYPAGFSTIILRYANVYGPRQSAQGEAGVVCSFIHQILDGKTPVIYGDGDQTRDFVYVDDVAAANLLALKPDAPPGIYNVGSGQPIRIRGLLDLLIGAGSPRAFAAPRSGDVRHSALDNTAIRSALGWQPSVSLVEGLAQTWRYFVNRLDAPARVSVPFNPASAY